MDAASFRVSWSRFPSHVLSALDELRHDEDFVDVDIYCAGRRIKAHRNVLSASSTYFKDIFKANPSSHPVVILCDVDFSSLRSLVDFMYHGEIEVPTYRLDQLLRLGEMLQVHGISTPKSPPSASAVSPGDTSAPECVASDTPEGSRKRRRRRSRRSGSPGHLAAEPGPPSCQPPEEPFRPVPVAARDALLPLLPVCGDPLAATERTPAAVQDGSGLLRPGPSPPQLQPSPPEAPPSPLPEAEDLTARPAAARSPSPGPAGQAAPLALQPTPPPPPLEPAAVKLEPNTDAESNLTLDEMQELAGLDSTPYLGVFNSSLGLGRPMTGAERARRYRERKKLKKLYESLLGQSPRREQLVVQL